MKCTTLLFQTNVSFTLKNPQQFVVTLFLSLTASFSVPYPVSFSRAPKLKYIIMCSTRQRGKLRIHALKCSVHSRHLTANPPLNFRAYQTPSFSPSSFIRKNASPPQKFLVKAKRVLFFNTRAWLAKKFVSSVPHARKFYKVTS
jgi:hypothetical protein